MNILKVFFLRVYCGLVLIADNNTTAYERAENLLKAVLTFGPIAFILENLHLWFASNKQFTTGVFAVVLINMSLGAYMHKKKKTFDWKKFLYKTITMILLINIVYIVLEFTIVSAGENFIAGGFRSALQVATLLYPGTKILKNVFILSKGEYPPKWIMNKIYNFEENGDLRDFMSTTKKEEPIIWEEDPETK